MMTEVVDMRERLEETAHPTLDYIEFGLDGAETLRSGYIWGPAPAVAGGRVFWVLNVADGVVVPPAVAVVVASRRHRVGWTVYVPTVVRKVRYSDLEYTVLGGVRWQKGKGRFVDKDEAYTENATLLSPTGRLIFVPPGRPTRITMPPLPDGVMDILLGAD
jgi:hypothetical protein